MYKKLYFMFAMGTLSALTIGQTQAATPTEVVMEHTTTSISTTAAPSESSILGIGSGKKTSSPEKLDRQLHQRQKQLKAKARHISRANWRRCQRG